MTTPTHHPEDAVLADYASGALRPAFAWARHNLGSLLGQLGEHEEAVACFRHIAAAMRHLPVERTSMTRYHSDTITKLAKRPARGKANRADQST